jgi:hypothetical protein
MERRSRIWTRIDVGSRIALPVACLALAVTGVLQLAYGQLSAPGYLAWGALVSVMTYGTVTGVRGLAGR